MEAAETSRRSIGELFVERGLITQSDLDLALDEQAATKRRLADILVRRGLVTGHDITSALMEQLGSPAPAGTPASEGTAEVIALPQPAPATDPEPEPAPAAAVEPMPEPTPLPGLPTPAHDPIAEADARCRTAEADLGAARESHARVLQELEQVHAALDARQEELTKQFANWQEARDEAERWSGRLDEFQTRLEQTDQELAEASATAAAWAARASELGSDAEALAGTVGSALHELDTMMATRFPADGAEPPAETDPPVEADPVDDGQTQPRSLYFVPNAEGYDLIERDGEAPAVGETVDLGDQQYAVTKIGPSPLPFDGRSCIFLAVVD